MKEHKPNCSSNLVCLVYHQNVPCPGYKECDCDIDNASEE